MHVLKLTQIGNSVGVILPVAWQGEDGGVEIHLGAKGVAEVQRFLAQ